MTERRGAHGRRGRPDGPGAGRGCRLGAAFAAIAVLVPTLLTAGLYGTATATGRPRDTAPPSTLAAGASLQPGQNLASPTGQFTLTMTPAGALVETSGNTQLWTSGTALAGSSAVLEADGQLAVVDPQGAPVWTTPAPAAPVPTGEAPQLVVEASGPLAVVAGTVTLWVSGPVDSTLVAGQELLPGWSLSTPNGQYTLTMQPAGALALTTGGAQLWSTGAKAPGAYVLMQADGNLVMYSAANHPLWSSGTAAHPGLGLALTGNGQVVLQNPAGVHLWGQPSVHWGLVPGQELAPGWYVRSPNNLFQLSMSAGGRLVEYLVRPGAAVALWYTKASPVAGSTATLQADGDLVLTAPSGTVVWSSGTAGRVGANLRLTDDADILLTEAGTTIWNSNSVTLGTVIVADAAGQLGNADNPSGSFCNPYTAYWGVGSACSNANRSEAWCADFAAWAWRQAGVPFGYGWSSGDINAAAASFYQWGSAHGTWHWASSGYRPRPGDVAVFGLSSSGTYADHAAIVLAPGTLGADVINGDWWSTGNGSVVLQDNESTATGSDVLSGYASPLPPRAINAHLATSKLVAEAVLTRDRALGRVRVDAAPAAALPGLARQAAAARASAGFGSA